MSSNLIKLSKFADEIDESLRKDTSMPLTQRSNDYSQYELGMIHHFGMQDHIGEVHPMRLYQMMIEHAFMVNDQSRWATALRIVYKKLMSCEVYRNTPEFDKLIADCLL
jgi:hypothetical protein